MNAFKRHLPTAARIFLGLIFTVMGSNGFFHFIPMPPPTAKPAAFMGAMLATGYFFPLLFGTQLLVGVLLLTRRFVPLALTLIAPVIVNIVAFHLFLAPAGMGLALAVLAAELTLAWSYRAAFAPLFQLSARPAAAGGTSLVPLPSPAQPLRSAA